MRRELRKRGSRRPRNPTPEGEQLLFDLPLEGPEQAYVERLPTVPRSAPEQTPLFGDNETAQQDPAATIEEPAGQREPVIAALAPRLLSGGADILIHAGVLAGVSLGLSAMAVQPQLDHWPALAVLLLAFSFLYTVVSLAFWGQTAGMAWFRLSSQDRLQRPLSFRQSALRWVGGLLTLALAGIPVLSALRWVSLSDWLSRSLTFKHPAGAEL